MKKKRILVFILIFLMSIVCVFAVACKPETPQGPIEPNTPVETTPSVLPEGPETGIYYYSPLDGGSDYLITLNSGDKFSFMLKGQTKSGTYKLEQEKLTLDFTYEKDTDIVANYRDNVITLTYENVQYRFLRQVNYAVNFETNGAGRIGRQIVLNGKTAKEPVDPVLDGYVFVGWYADESLSTPFLFNTTPITKDTKVYARWEARNYGQKEFLIKFDVGYDGGENPASVQTKNGRLFANMLETPERTDYEFKGWWVSMYGDKDRLSYEVTEDVKFSENMTLYALWAEPNSTAPIISVTESGIEFERLPNVNYTISINGPEGFEGIDGEQIQAVDIKDIVDFASAPMGDYEITITAISGGNSVSATRWYKNKALAKVSLFNVVEPSMLMYNSIEHADNYYITIECGNSYHKHTLLNNGNSTHYNFANCLIGEEGIKFTVTAKGEGFEDSVSDTFVYNRVLDKIEGFDFDAETDTLSWSRVSYATNYMVKVLSGNSEQAVINNGNKNSFSLKDYTGSIVVEVYPATKGYNSPAAATFRHTKTRLATPTDIKIDGKAISWKAVEGAESYELTIGEKTYTTIGKEASYELTEDDLSDWTEGGYKLKIKAKAASSTNDSLYSDAIDIGYLTLYGTLTYEDRTVRWGHVIGAEAYEVKVNDGAAEVVTGGVNYKQVKLTRSGENKISVRVKTESNNGDWLEITVFAYRIILDTNEGTPVDDLFLARGDTIEFPESTKEGYEVEGWYTTPLGANSNGYKYDDTTFNDMGDVLLYAYWIPKQITITLDVLGQGDITSTTTVVTYGENYKLEVPTPTDATMAFAGWYNESGTVCFTDSEGVSLTYWYLPEGVTLYAKWLKTLSYVRNDNSTPDDETDDYYEVRKGEGIDYVSSVTVPATYNGLPVSYVAASAFSRCYTLKEINLPYTIIDIGGNAFAECDALEAVNVDESQHVTERFSSAEGVLIDNNSVTGFKEIFFCPMAKTGKLELPYGVAIIPLGVFSASKISEIFIPVSVTAIFGDAFSYCRNLTTVTFEKGAIGEQDPHDASKTIGALTIESKAFQYCTSLTDITLPARLDSFTNDIFDWCDSLASIGIDDGNEKYFSKNGVLCSVENASIIFCPIGMSGTFTIPDQIIKIEKSSFYKCKKITELIIPGWVTSIEERAFEQMEGLKKVTFKADEFDTPLTVGTRAFSRCSNLLTVEFEVGSHVQSLGDYCFENCSSLTSFEFPASMTSVGRYSFSYCSSLRIVSFADHGEEISFGASAFDNCLGLREIHIPANVSKIDANIFSGCNNLTTIEVDDQNPNYKAEGGVLFNKQMTEILFYSPGLTEAVYEIPESVEIVAAAVFKKNKNLVTVTIGANVTEIQDEAFSGCSNLKTVIFKESNKPLTIGAEAFCDTSALTGITLPERITEIGDSAFDSSAISTVKIYKNWTLGDGVFADAKLVSVEIENGFKKIPAHTFQRTKISTIMIPNTVTLIGASAFYYCSSLESITFEKDGTEALVFGADINEETGTFGNGMTFASSAIKSIEIPNRVTLINYYDFNYCRSLQTVTFEKGGTLDLIIGGMPGRTGESFSSCDLLEEISFPARLVKLEVKVFQNCAKLSSVTFEDGTQDLVISDYAFASTSLLSVVELPSNLAYIGAYAFQKSSIYEIEIPNKVRNNVEGANSVFGIGDSAFADCKILTTVTFAEGGNEPLSIGPSVFSGCSELTEITLPSRLASVDSYSAIGDNAFYNCSSLASINVDEGCKEFSSSDGVLYKNGADGSKDVLMICPAKKSGTVTVPGTVTMIADNAFQNNKAITNVEFLDGDKSLSIGNRAFYGCSMLTTIELPARLNNIGSYSFASSGLTEITIPANVETMGEDAFESCASLKTVTFAAGCKLTELKNYLFNGCSVLSTVTFADDSAITKIGNYVFQRTGALKNIDLPAKLLELGNYVFSNSGITTITLPDTVKTLGSTVFSSCKALTSVTLSNSLETKIAVSGYSSTFSGCDTLSEVNVSEGGTTLFGSENGVLYYNDAQNGKTLYYYPAAKKGAFSIGGDVKTIGDSAFYGNTSITGITIPASVTLISNSAFYNCSNLGTVTFIKKGATEGLTIGTGTSSSNVFYNCAALKAIEIPARTEAIGKAAFNNCKALADITFEEDCRLSVINSETFANTAITKIIIPKNITTINSDAFKNCASLATIEYERGSKLTTFGGFYGSTFSSIEIPVGVTEISDNAFQNNTKLTRVVIPAGVKIIGKNAFYGCSGLESIDLPASLELICDSAFRGCALTTVTIPKNVGNGLRGDTQTIGIGDNAFYDNKKLTKVVFEDAETATKNLTMGASVFRGCSLLNEIELPARLTDDYNKPALGNYAFYDCAALTDITLPIHVTTLSSYMFGGCKALENVNIMGTITKIDSYAFQNCSVLEDIVINSNINTFGDYAFANCTNLKSVTFNGSINVNLGKWAFQNLKNLTDVTLPKVLKGIGMRAFYQCSNLVNISLPSTLEVLDSSAFEGCISLTSIMIPGKVTTIGGSAFSGCSSLSEVDIQPGVKTISYSAFAGCTSLKHLYIPASVTSLTDSAISTVEEITLEPGNQAYVMDEASGAILNAAMDSIIFFPKHAKSFEFPANFTRTYNAHIAGSDITEVTLHGGITTIYSDTFKDCKKLQKVIFKGAFTKLEISSTAFSGCSALESIELPEGTTSVGRAAFENCTSLRSVKLTNTLETLSSNLFYNCTSLKRIEIPDSVTKIDASAFEKCTGLTEVIFGNKINNIGSKAFAGCTGITSITIPNTVTTMGSNVFDGWGDEQTIVIKFAKDAVPQGWDSSWKTNCSAKIEYDNKN